MKTIIAGCRHFKDPKMVEEAVRIAHTQPGWETPTNWWIFGCARGVDKMAEAYALNTPFPRSKYYAHWDLHGKAAGPIRNAEMAVAGDRLIAIWDGKSKGTANMIDHMERLNKPVFIYNPVEGYSGLTTPYDDIITPEVPDTDYLAMMYDYTEEQRLQAEMECNIWEWPKAFNAFKPEGFDKLKNYDPLNKDNPNTKVACKEWQNLHDALKETTTEWGRSWFWNKRPGLFQKTKAQHLEFWRKQKQGLNSTAVPF